jgi:predicted RNase H-like HicB family nuclease
MFNQFPYPITIKIIKEFEAKDAPFVAYIPEFDVSSCGKTEEEAAKNVKEVLNITIEEVTKDGNLDTFMEELGFRQTKKKNDVVRFLPKVIFEQFYLPQVAI